MHSTHFTLSFLTEERSSFSPIVGLPVPQQPSSSIGQTLPQAHRREIQWLSWSWKTVFQHAFSSLTLNYSSKSDFANPFMRMAHARNPTQFRWNNLFIEICTSNIAERVCLEDHVQKVFSLFTEKNSQQ